MIEFKIKEQLEEKGISRYKLQKLTSWNYRRINSYYFGKTLEIHTEELDKLCEVLKCRIEDLIEYKKEQ